MLPETAPFPAEQIVALNSIISAHQRRAADLAERLPRRLSGGERAAAGRGRAAGAPGAADHPVRHRIRQRRGAGRCGAQGGRQAGLRRAGARHGGCHAGAGGRRAEPAGDRQHLGRGRSAAARDRFLRRADGRRCAALRRRALCRAGAGRPRLREVLRDRPACSTNASPRSVRRGWPSGSNATWTTRRRPPRWIDATLGTLQAELGEPEAGAVIHVDFARAPAEARAWSRARPFEAEITERIRLSGSRSTSDTWHVELSLEGAGIAYEPGDSLGFVPANDPALVDAVLAATGLSGNAQLRAAAVGAVRHHHADWQRDSRDRRRSRRPDAGRQVIDLLEAAPRKLTEEQLLSLLRPLAPRYYSIASSRKAVPDEAHLLVAAVRYEAHGRARNGVASVDVAERRKTGDRLRVFLKPNPHFRLPADPRAADHHDRAGHRRGAVPRLHAGARCGRRARPELAGVRPSQLHARLPVPARMAGPAEARRADAAGRGVLARPAGEALRAARAVGCAARAARVGAGWCGDLRVRRRQRDGEGRARHAAAGSRRQGGKDGVAALDALRREGRYLRDVYCDLARSAAMDAARQACRSCGQRARIKA